MVISLLGLQQPPFNGSPYLQPPHNLRSELAKTPISFCHFTVWNLCRPPITLRIKFKLFKVTHRPPFMICVLSPSLAVACFTLSWTVVRVILIFYSWSDVRWCYLPPCLCTFIFFCLESPLSDSHLTWWTQRLTFFERPIPGWRPLLYAPYATLVESIRSPISFPCSHRELAQ